MLLAEVRQSDSLVRVLRLWSAVDGVLWDVAEQSDGGEGWGGNLFRERFGEERLDEFRHCIDTEREI